MNKRKATRRDVVTLADLAPRRDIKGGSGRLVFGADAPATAPREDTMAGTKKAKDLTPKTKVKGGRLSANSNWTLIRHAKPVKKDLSPTKNPKGGKKTR